MMPKSAATANVILFVVLLALAFWFVHALQGITPDTTFLAVYFAVLGTFSINALLFAFHRHY